MPLLPTLATVSRPRLKTVADLAEVSEPTVSRVLNGRTGVSETTRARVIDALEELGYTNVPEGTGPRRGVIGIITGELTNPVFSMLVDNVASTISEHGLVAMVSMLRTEERSLEEFAITGVDGVVFIGGKHAQIESDLSAYEALMAKNIPLIFVNGRQTGLDATHIYCDEEAGAVKAIEHLVALGHRKIGCVLGDPVYIPTKRVAEGFHSAMASAGLSPDDDAIIHTAFTFEGGRAGVKRMIENGYTGLLMSNDMMALGGVTAAEALGVSVPSELSLVGYDGTSITALTSPALTTLRQPFEQMTKLIADALASELSGSRQFRDTYVFEPELVSRESSGRFEGRGRRSTD